MDFHTRMTRLGFTLSAVKEGPINEQVELKDIQQLRQFVDVQGSLEERRSRFEAIFKGTPDYNDSQLRAAEEYVFGLSDDASLLMGGNDPAFPVVAYLEANEPLVVDGKKDLSTPNGEMRRAAYSKVTIKAGGYIVVEATPLDFTCDELILEGEPPAGMGHFNILGKTGAPHAPLKKPVTPGQTNHGADANCGSDKAGAIGEKPIPGTPGGTGARGNDGIPSQLANIEVNTSLTVTGTTKLRLATRSGAGGKGQDGGAGGDAGQGGNGGKGTACGCGGRNGGPGRTGGTGGKGGRAGDGGDGSDAAANISLRVPSADFGKVDQTAITATAPPGKAGERGAAGGRGAGGHGGAAGSKGSTKGADANAGAEGQIGDPGADGTKHGAAAQFNPQPF